MSSAGTAATFAITDTKLYVSVVTFKTEDNAKLSKLLSEGFKRSIYWNEYNASLENDLMKGLMLVFKVLIDCVFLLMHMVIILLMKTHIEDIFFEGLK